jgi:hypothetical protein
MNWAEETYWVVLFDGSLVATSIDDPSVAAILREAKVVLVPVNEFSPCKDCPFLETCMGSIWIDENRLGGPGEAKSSVVSICDFCNRKVFILEGESGKTVSQYCPRHSVKGPDCQECFTRRQSWGIN